MLSLVVHAAALFGLLFAMAVRGGPDQAETLITIDFVAAPPAPEPGPALAPPPDVVPPEPAPEPIPEPAQPTEAPPLPTPPLPTPPTPTPPPPEPVQPPPPVAATPATPPKPKPPAKAPRKRAAAKPTPGPARPATVAAPPGLAASVPSVAIRPAAPTPSEHPEPSRDDRLRDYGNRVWARVARHKPSGMIARGTAVVRFSISAEGNLIAATIATSSGVNALDRASLAAVSAASPFPSPPPGASPDQLTFTIPFDYR